MTLNYKLLLIFVSMWVSGEVAQVSYSSKLLWALIITIGFAYIENAHGIAWQYLKNQFLKN